MRIAPLGCGRSVRDFRLIGAVGDDAKTADPQAARIAKAARPLAVSPARMAHPLRCRRSEQDRFFISAPPPPATNIARPAPRGCKARANLLTGLAVTPWP